MALPSLILEAPKFYAIQLKDTEHRHWKGDDYETVVYRWNDIETNVSKKLEDIYIDVTKAYPQYSPEHIKNIGLGITTYPKIKEGTAILGVIGKRIVKKVGVVKSNFTASINLHQTTLHIEWKKEIEESEAKSDVFDEMREVQNVGKRTLNKLNLPVAFSDTYSDMRYAGEKVILSPHLEHFELANAEERDEKGGMIYLFYGTNRNDTGSSDPNLKYGIELDTLKYGVCSVNIPKGHLQGEIERPTDLWIVEFPEKKTDHVILTEVIELGESDLLNKLRTDLNKLDSKAASIFVHGYNNSFAEAARRAAQIAWDVPFEGLSGFFSWPSVGVKAAYLKDIERADASIPDLCQFIESIIQSTGIEKLHLIAHSMGNRVLTASINELSNREQLHERIKVIEQVILAAPDLDREVFNRNILPKLRNVPARKTLYASERDEALQVSEFIRYQLPRLGLSGLDLFVANNLDTVDASNVQSSGNHHSYIFDTKELLSDLYYLLNNGFPPAKRRLRRKLKEDLPYWIFAK